MDEGRAGWAGSGAKMPERTANINILCVDYFIVVDDFYTQAPFTTLPSLTHQS